MVQENQKHECVIGMLNEWDEGRLVTLSDLKAHIVDSVRLMSVGAIQKAWSLTDYTDRRKSTDLTQFEYCPYCGQKIDWTAIRKTATNNASQFVDK